MSVRAVTTLQEDMAHNKVFDSTSAEKLLSDLRRVYRSNKTKSIEWRQEQLAACERLVTENEVDIKRALHADLGRPGLEAWTTEIFAVSGNAQSSRKSLKSWMQPQKVSANLASYPSKCYIDPKPLGVVLIIGPWNYPFMLSMEPLIGAIAAGNCVVLKPSEVSSETSKLIARLAAKYLDPEAVRIVEGGIPETSALLEQKWDKIFYTGNGAVGRIVATAAAKHLTPVILELGGKCPAIVDSTVDLKSTAKRIAFGRFYNGGQTCIAADYILAEKDVADKLVDALRETLVEFYGPEGTASPDMARVINKKQFDRLSGYLADERVKKKIVFGGIMDEEKLFISPTIVRDAPWDSALLNEEIFGPILPIQTVKNLEEAIEIVNDKPTPLAVYPFSKDKNIVRKILDATQSGGACVNDTILHLANPGLPFGGVGESGYGSYHGKATFDAFTHFRSVMEKDFGQDVSVRFPPYTPYKEHMIKALMTGDVVGLVMLLLGFRK